MIRRTAVLLAAVVALVAGASASHAEDHASLGIFAETSMVVMPMMAGMADMLKNLPKGIELPDNVKAMMGGGEAIKKLEIRLTSPGEAPEDAFAWIAPPAGLKAGKRLDLQIARPEPPDEEEEDVPDVPMGMPNIEDMTIKIYWGSSPTVLPGQPRVIRIGDLPEVDMAQFREQMEAAMARAGQFYRPDWTEAFWPTEKQPGELKPESSLVGEFALTTNYTGNVSITAPEDVDFLAPFTLSSPSTEGTPDLAEPLELAWEQIEHCLGIHASAVGFEGRNTLVMWVCSETLPEGYTGMDMNYLEMAQVRQYVAEGLMLEGDATEATIPAGIFEDCAMPMLSMVGYGPGVAVADVNPLPRIQTKTTLTMQLGDMMKGAMGMMGGPPGGDEE